MPIIEPLVLIIEDDSPKFKAINGYLQEFMPDAQLIHASSLTSAIQVLSTKSVTLAIIDMSLPTYDAAKDRTGGGQPQGYGGIDILRFIETESPDTYGIVLTQYEEFLSSFGEPKDLDSLRKELEAKFSPYLLGVVYYSSLLGDWRTSIKELLDQSGIKI